MNTAPSLQWRLVVRLAALFVAGAAVLAGFLAWRAYDTADSLSDRELSLRAADLARYVTADGEARLVLPDTLQKAYADPASGDIFAIRQAEGRIVAASPPAFGQIVQRWAPTTEHAAYFRLDGLAGAGDYYGLGLTVDSAAGPLSIWVARAAGATALIHSFLEEFMFDIAWVIPLFMLLTLAVAVLAIRSTLKPIRDVSQVAASVGPASTSVRLPTANLPAEIVPLVGAVNRALDRLEQGFAVQREFTANAAHELRTPLAIVTAALDGLRPDAEVDKLKVDVARMNRLVEQLLSVARLDAVALDLSADVDLNEPAKDVIVSLAPWAVAQGRAIGFAAAGRPVVVRGNSHAIADAVRNLVENAVVHSPPGAEVTVAVHEDGRICVSDRGPGVTLEIRERIFERFWRGAGARSRGAGLGLAIVAEIMKAHGGAIIVGDAADGGAIFTLAFSPAALPAGGRG
ncbi:MAG: HAMP domain-containing protein [Proteobacteria bacterium]|nr:HAMP domain-containing protein [Pseudomonadota bacterium]